ncbi:hypothetical protein SDC9_125283 [bioreactor metagenome]|uniref:Xylose isomerase-like TIM barrel domain-containing protein n=1 Tax=bioreactor metagenome TaxID=1076179 RepID=A0A645CNC8_9ZZZZ
MKIGCGVQFDEISTARDLGFDFVELRGKAVQQLSPRLFEDLVTNLIACQMPCLSLNAYCPPDIVIAGVNYDRQKAQDYARALADRAKLLGVRKVGIGSPMSRQLPHGFDLKLAWKQAVEFTADAANIFGAEGIQISFEALGGCFCNFINHVDTAVSLIQELSDFSVGLVLDFYNMEKSDEADLPLNAFSHLISHVHVSDDLGSCTQRSFLLPEKYLEHTARIKRLMGAGYNDTLSLEIDIPLDERAGQSLKFLQSLCRTPNQS